MRTPTRAGDAGRRTASRAAPAHPAPRIRKLRPEQRGALARLLRDTRFFRDEEVAVALEVIDAYFDAPDQDYSALGAFTPGGSLIGYVCYGPTPMTNGTHDLYWIAVSPSAQNAGVGTRLLQEVERRLARSGARLVIIETSSQPLYEPTRAFYLRRGYAEVARVPDFYAEGDDRVIYAKRIQTRSRGKPNG